MTRDGGRFLSPEQAAQFYDRIGIIQDWQGFYEKPAVREMLRLGGFESAKAVLEFGCGTGAFAAQLLSKHLPPESRYVGVDASPNIVRLATARLRPWQAHAVVQLTTGSAQLEVADRSFDRFVSNYVFDVLAPHYAASLLKEAYRVLRSDGRLCLVSLTNGTTAVSRIVTAVWNKLWLINPELTGGCRPVLLEDLLDRELWLILHRTKIVSFGIPSEVLVATPIPQK